MKTYSVNEAYVYFSLMFLFYVMTNDKLSNQIFKCIHLLRSLSLLPMTFIEVEAFINYDLDETFYFKEVGLPVKTFFRDSSLYHKEAHLYLCRLLSQMQQVIEVHF